MLTQLNQKAVCAFELAAPALTIGISLHATPARIHVNLPFEESGAIGNAPYRVVAPAGWNGTLLVWAQRCARQS